MKTIALFGLLACGALAVPAPDDRQFFAALGMTKEQVNSPAPAISGVFRQVGPNDWRHFGGEQIAWVNTAAQVAAAPGTMFLGCGNGILRSRDAGRHWRLTTGWQVADVLSLQIDPVAPATVYAATGWGVWKTIDGGEVWRESDDGLRPDGKYSYAVALDRLVPGRLLDGTDFGLYVSTDRARRWRRVLAGPSAPVLHLEQSGADPRCWLIGTLGKGAWLSRDGAETWMSVAPELASAHVYGVALDPTDGSRMAAAGWKEGVEVSSDGGRTWINRTSGLGATQVSQLAFDPRRPGRLWASTFQEGTFFTDDLGGHWTLGGLYGASVIELKFLPGFPTDAR